MNCELRITNCPLKVLLVNGSPHEHGCTRRALDEVAKTLNGEGVDTEIYWVGAKPVGGCMGCFKCQTLKRCVINDGVNEFRASSSATAMKHFI